MDPHSGSNDERPLFTCIRGDRRLLRFHYYRSSVNSDIRSSVNSDITPPPIHFLDDASFQTVPTTSAPTLSTPPILSSQPFPRRRNQHQRRLLLFPLRRNQAESQLPPFPPHPILGEDPHPPLRGSFMPNCYYYFFIPNAYYFGSHPFGSFPFLPTLPGEEDFAQSPAPTDTLVDAPAVDEDMSPMLITSSSLEVQSPVPTLTLVNEPAVEEDISPMLTTASSSEVQSPAQTHTLVDEPAVNGDISPTLTTSSSSEGGSELTDYNPYEDRAANLPDVYEVCVLGDHGSGLQRFFEEFTREGNRNEDGYITFAYRGISFRFIELGEGEVDIPQEPRVQSCLVCVNLTNPPKIRRLKDFLSEIVARTNFDANIVLVGTQKEHVGDDSLVEWALKKLFSTFTLRTAYFTDAGNYDLIYNYLYENP